MITMAQQDTHRCDVCRAAPGVGFFDTSWTCAACRTALEQWLRSEPYRNVNGPMKGGAQMVFASTRKEKHD